MSAPQSQPQKILVSISLADGTSWLPPWPVRQVTICAEGHIRIYPAYSNVPSIFHAPEWSMLYLAHENEKEA